MEIGGIVVGLGNPGNQYKNNRHNLGFLVLEQFLEEIAPKYRVEQVSTTKFSCVLFKVNFEKNIPWFFAFPQTFMNLSGECVQPLLAWYKTNHEKLIVVHDELDLTPGRIQLKKGGGAAGHNGLKSITQRLSTQDYYRLRIGIGRPPDPANLSSWVLGGFGEDKDLIIQSQKEACTGLMNIIQNGITKSMNEINMRKKIPNKTCQE